MLLQKTLIRLQLLKITSVGIVMSHRAEMIAAILAVLKCDARYVPAEPNFPTGRIEYVIICGGVGTLPYFLVKDSIQLY